MICLMAWDRLGKHCHREQMNTYVFMIANLSKPDTEVLILMGVFYMLLHLLTYFRPLRMLRHLPK